MNTTLEKWQALSPIIAQGIAAAEDGCFALSEERLRRTYGIEKDEWSEILLLNKDEEKFDVRKGWDWEFRLPPAGPE